MRRHVVPVFVVLMGIILILLLTGCGSDTAAGGEKGSDQQSGSPFGSAQGATQSTAEALYQRDYKTLYENVIPRWRDRAGSQEAFGKQLETVANYIDGDPKSPRRQVLPKGEIKPRPNGFVLDEPVTGSNNERVAMCFNDPKGRLAVAQVELAPAGQSMSIANIAVQSPEEANKYEFNVPKIQQGNDLPLEDCP